MTTDTSPPAHALTVVVHGATGTQGAPVVRQLLAAGHRVRAAVRNPRSGQLHPGVEPVAVDMSDPDSLTAAYTGANAVFIQLPLTFAPDEAARQAEAVVTALGKAEMRRAMFNTGGGVSTEPVGEPFLDARAWLAAALPQAVEKATVIAPAQTYMENLTAPWSAPLVRNGEVIYPLPADLPVPWVTLEDVGAIAVDLLEADLPAPVRVIAGPQALTGEQVAAELTAALEHPVRWRTATPGEYETMLSPHLGAEAAAGIAALYTPPPPGTPPAQGPDPAVIVTAPTTLRDWARQQNWACL